MSGAYNRFIDDNDDDLIIKIAIEAGLLTECEYHEGEYYDSCAAIEEQNIEQEINKKLIEYNISMDRKLSIFRSVKNIQNMYQDKCIICAAHGL